MHVRFPQFARGGCDIRQGYVVLFGSELGASEVWSVMLWHGAARVRTREVRAWLFGGRFGVASWYVHAFHWFFLVARDRHGHGHVIILCSFVVVAVRGLVFVWRRAFGGVAG